MYRANISQLLYTYRFPNCSLQLRFILNFILLLSPSYPIGLPGNEAWLSFHVRPSIRKLFLEILPTLPSVTVLLRSNYGLIRKAICHLPQHFPSSITGQVSSSFTRKSFPQSFEHSMERVSWWWYLSTDERLMQ